MPANTCSSGLISAFSLAGPQLTCRVHLHLRCLSTGALHPPGHRTALLMHEPQPRNYLYTIKSLDGYLGILTTNHEYGSPSELFVY